MNTQLIDALAANLEDDIDTQNQLLSALRWQRERLLEGDADGCDGVTDRIRNLLDRADRNRSRRASLLRSLGIDPTSEAPIEKVAHGTEDARAERLVGLRRMLVGLAAEVRSLNQFNAQLVRRSAELVDGLLRIFAGLGEVPGYGLSGAPNRLRAGGVLVNAEV